MNEQKFYNDVRRRLLTQMKHCKQGMKCTYRNDAMDLACGIGGTFPDSVYPPIIDSDSGYSVEWVLSAEFPELIPLREYWYATYAITDTPDEIEFMHTLQQVHDLHMPCEWEGALSAFARCYGLSCPDVSSET